MSLNLFFQSSSFSFISSLFTRASTLLSSDNILAEITIFFSFSNFSISNFNFFFSLLFINVKTTITKIIVTIHTKPAIKIKVILSICFTTILSLSHITNFLKFKKITFQLFLQNIIIN